MLEDIFETGRGTYQLDTETGLFTLKGQPSTPKRFLGSVDPEWEIDLYGTARTCVNVTNPAVRAQLVLSNFIAAKTSGFTPLFREGYFPFGIVCAPEDIVLVGEGQLVFTDQFKERIKRYKDRSIKFQLGCEMERVYRQLQDQERGYRVLQA